jgi:hypothetical protein
MIEQPGLESIQMHQPITDNELFLELALWRSTNDLKAAIISEEFGRRLELFPECTSSGIMLERLLVPGICEGEPLRSLRQDLTSEGDVAHG